jgi:hypothetical protein
VPGPRLGGELGGLDCLYVTEVGPARMNALFARSISVERREPPDIDSTSNTSAARSHAVHLGQVPSPSCRAHRRGDLLPGKPGGADSHTSAEHALLSARTVEMKNEPASPPHLNLTAPRGPDSRPLASAAQGALTSRL